jgi:hypothetical protein
MVAFEHGRKVDTIDQPESIPNGWHNLCPNHTFVRFHDMKQDNGPGCARQNDSQSGSPNASDGQVY